MFVDQREIQAARAADLHCFLMRNHADLFKRVGDSICMKQNSSLYIKSGFYGYRDFSNGETGNGIDFLVRHLGYTFQEAVAALADSHPSETQLSSTGEANARKIVIPERAPLPHSRMYAYLMSRSIPKDVIDKISREGIAYQSAINGNIVFVTKELDYCELRGTYTYGNASFHGCRKTKADRFWYLLPGRGRPVRAYITEAAIDAISLMVLHCGMPSRENSVYISIGGVSNYAAINRIKKKIHTILAVDNDPAGAACRGKYPDLENVIPIHKDWNEDLMSLSKT